MRFMVERSGLAYMIHDSRDNRYIALSTSPTDAATITELLNLRNDPSKGRDELLCCLSRIASLLSVNNEDTGPWACVPADNVYDALALAQEAITK